MKTIIKTGTEKSMQTTHVYSRSPIDPHGNDSLSKIVRCIKPGSIVLDIGCGVGTLGQYLSENMRCIVDGINANLTELDQARPFYRTLWEWNLEQEDLPKDLKNQCYNYIVCADVLEHLKNPGCLLVRLQELLTPEGKFLISIPNVGHIGVILELLNGDFRYRPEGLLDQTHIRFFTRQSFLRFLDEYGFSGRVVDQTIVPLQVSEFAEWLTTIDNFSLGQNQSEEWTIYQYIVEAVPHQRSSMIPSCIKTTKINNQNDFLQLTTELDTNSNNHIIKAENIAKIKTYINKLAEYEVELAALHAEFDRPLYKIARFQRRLAIKIPGLVKTLKISYKFAKVIRSRISHNKIQIPDKISEYIGTLSASNCTTYHNAEQWYNQDDPEVSIIVLNWNKGRMTAQCLHEIWKHTKDVSYEIIVLDNGSKPIELLPISTITGPFKMIRLGVNRMFGEGNNIAAESAKGKYLLFLNNDAFVTNGWLKPLVESISESRVGAAGPMFIYPDGRLQECGSFIDVNGDPKQRGKGLQQINESLKSSESVHYISAACLLFRRDLFEQLDGFSLDFEPAYYEDVDLCFRLRKLGYVVRYIPESIIVHIENYSHRETGEAMMHSIVLNRQRFIDKHKDIIGMDIVSEHHTAKELVSSSPMRGKFGTLGLYTPFALTPGGGERYLLSIASVLSHRFDVVIITPEVYSNARLRQLGKSFGLDLSGIITETWNNALRRSYDFFISMGNHITPDVPALAQKSFFICQFPFPSSPSLVVERAQLLYNYQGYIAYSNYAMNHIANSQEILNLPIKPIDVIYPPCPLVSGEIRKSIDRIIILSVGRFFRGGHCKNHHLLVQAFRKLVGNDRGCPIEFHIAGSVHPNPESLDYFHEVRQLANDLPVTLHPNIGSIELAELYRKSHIYWHGTGMDKDPAIHPDAMEHFGIAIVESMGAGCVPLAFNAGGPAEIITDGHDGFLFGSENDLIKHTIALINDRKKLCDMSRTAKIRASDFSTAIFSESISNLLADNRNN